jgi:glycosyltransferase involved in cell wall biosynthesis
MRILLVHNRYQQAGGEDAVFENERRLFQRFGHEVVTYERDNREIARASLARKTSLGLQTFWSWESAKALAVILRQKRPDAALFTNTFPLISPSAHYVCKRAGVPVLQSIHNYRYACPSALLYRDSSVCEECLGNIPWRSIVHRCYRNSAIQTAAAAVSLTGHKLLGTLNRSVDAYIVLTEFAQQKLVQAGLPREKVFLRTNFVDPDPGPGALWSDHALFVGRLTEEKGIPTLLAAWKLRPGPRLDIIGDGPLAPLVQSAAASIPNVRYLGRLPHDLVLQAMGSAGFLLFPSTWYEGQPMTILEALAKGLPVVGSRLGGIPETIGNGGTTFPPGDAIQLYRTVRSLRLHAGLRTAARFRFLTCFSGDTAHRRFLDILGTIRGASS